MSSYLLINIFVIVIPLCFSFERKVRFYRKLPSVIASIIVVGILYIVWDIIATARGDWAFNAEYVLPLRIFGLPIEEILFFITVPYACLFTYEVIRSRINERVYHLPDLMMIILPVPFLIVALTNTGQPYTQTVFLFIAAFFILSSWLYPNLLKSRSYLIYILITFVPFIIVNGILTSVPIVMYGPDAFSGIRIFTIPLEDFFYSLSMLSFHVLVFRLVLNRWQPHLL
jgi:lycopene cyclase domain-containing protein